MKTKKTTTPPIRNSIKRQALHRGFKAIVNLSLSCMLVALTQQAFAQNGTWETKAPMSQGVVEATGIGFGGLFYVFDGSNGTIIAPQAYDPVTNSWSFKAADPVSRSFTAVGMINNKIYVAEGWIGADSSNPTTALRIYDPATNSWSSGADASVARGASAAAVIGSKLYVTGGSRNGNSVKFSDLEIYDSSTNSWSTGAPMPLAIEYPASGAINGKFYVVGGDYGPSNTGNTISNLLFIYDPATNSWSSGAPMPTPRDGPVAGVIDGKLYVVDGSGATGAATAALEIYDPVSNTWTTGPAAPTARSLVAGGVVGSQLYVAGGYNASGTIVNTLEVFTPAPIPCHRGDGDGDVEDAHGHEGHHHFHKRSTCGDPNDNENDNVSFDDNQGSHFQSTSVTASTFSIHENGPMITMVGTGVHNGLPVEFTMIGDVAPPLFQIVLTDGYTFTGTLVNGTIEIQ